MTPVIEAPPIDTLADLLHRLGDIPLERVRFRPPPGTATEKDVLEIEARENRLCELIDGVLVEKAMGYRESLLAAAISSYLRDFVKPRKLGLVTGADGMIRLFGGLVRIPDVAFASWSRIPGGVVPEDAIPDVAPDLAVEVLSRSNTRAEMQRKRDEYFTSGVHLVWIVDPAARTVTVYADVEKPETLGEQEILDGGDVLSGFSLPLSELFAELDERDEEQT